MTDGRDAASSPEHVVREWLAAFNRGDADAMVALYADDAQHTSPRLRDARPASGGRLVGKAALRRWWQEAFDNLPGIRYELVNLIPGEGIVAFEYVRHRPGEAGMQVAEVFEIREGKIVRSHVYLG
jgi:hypothetical protein